MVARQRFYGCGTFAFGLVLGLLVDSRFRSGLDMVVWSPGCISQSLALQRQPTESPRSRPVPQTSNATTETTIESESCHGKRPLVELQQTRHTGFVLLAEQRSGTHMMTTSLYQHPCIDVQPEILYDEKPGNPGWSSSALRREAIEAYYNTSSAEEVNLSRFPRPFQVYYNDSRLQLANSSKSILGINLKVNQGFVEDWDPWWRDFLLKAHMSIIWLYRKNTLRLVISAELLRLSGVSVVLNSKDRSRDAAKLTVKVKYILYELQKLKDREKDVLKRLAQAEDAGIPVLRLAYEKLSHASVALAERFVLYRARCSKTCRGRREDIAKKQHNKRLNETVENFDELEAALKGTDFEWMLKG